MRISRTDTREQRRLALDNLIRDLTDNLHALEAVQDAIDDADLDGDPIDLEPAPLEVLLSAVADLGHDVATLSKIPAIKKRRRT